jgi:hypothetical protein
MQRADLIKKLNDEISDIGLVHSITSISPGTECNASRAIMLANNLKQTQVMENPDFPRVFSGMENSFGKLCKGYKKTVGEWRVVKRIQKYSDGPIFAIILFNDETNTLDVIENPFAEDGPERFGYKYNYEALDKLHEGDVVPDGTVLYKSNSYDDNMNYRMGFSARVAYNTSISTLEDGIIIRESFANSKLTNEVSSFVVSINDNEVPLLIHHYDGTDHAIPKIGQVIEGTNLMAIKRINKRKIAFDFTNDSVTKPDKNCSIYTAGKNSVIYDIDIYYNDKNEFPDNSFYRELNKYYKEQYEYYSQIFDICEEFKMKGCNRTSNTDLIHKKAKDFIVVNDSDFKWKNKERAFSYINIVFHYIKTLSLHEGYKIVGRYGDKGVISERRKDAGEILSKKFDPTDPRDKLIAQYLGITGSPEMNVSIVPDACMYYDEDGRYVDICQNASAAYRREDTGQLTEVEINFISEEVVKEAKKRYETEGLDAAFNLLMSYAEQFPESEMRAIAKEWDMVYVVSKNLWKTTKKNKERFVQDIFRDGFYLQKLPTADWRFERICKLYDMYPFIKRKTMYINKFGIKHKVVNPMIVGEKYFFILKQNSNKNFSARSVSKVNKLGLPSKSSDKKESRTNTSDTPINRGETYNLLAAVDAATLMTSDIFTKNSPIARRDFKDIIISPLDPFKARPMKIKQSYTNVNVLNLKARLKVMGIGFDIITDKFLAYAALDQYKTFMKFNAFTFFDYGFNRKYYAFLINNYNKLKNKDKSFEDTWNGLISLDDFKMLEIDQEIVDNVYAIFNEHYGKVVVAETPDTETTTENKEIEIVDTIPDV